VPLRHKRILESKYQIIAMDVGTDFDVKELLFRNYAGDAGDGMCVCVNC
jgi:hypothetical protein